MNAILGKNGRAAAIVFFVSVSAAVSLAAAQVAARPAAGGTGGGDSVALVNGRPVSKQDLIRVLIDAHGLEAMQQLIMLELARQESRNRGVNVSQADIDAEYLQSIERIAREAGIVGETATPENKKKALETLLSNKQISMAEFMVSMERNAHLRKVVARQVTISEATLRAEFARTHGERRQIRRISFTLQDKGAIEQAQMALKNGSSFDEAARRYSKDSDSGAMGGMMDPFTFDDSQIPPALREWTFGATEGQVSTAIQVEQMIHILKLERVIAPDTSSFEDVKAEVEREVRERAITQEMTKLATDLYAKAKITVLEAPLKGRYEEFAKTRKNAATP